MLSKFANKSAQKSSIFSTKASFERSLFSWISSVITFLILPLQSVIYTTYDFGLIEEVVRQLDKNALVLFDVDETLFVPVDAILQPQNSPLFTSRIKFDRSLFREIRSQAMRTLVDPRSVLCIKKLQKKGIATLAFTAAPGQINPYEFPCDWRIKELSEFDFNFQLALPHLPFMELPLNPEAKYIPMYKSGVLFSSFHPKGPILQLFLQKIHWRPSKVVFVDDLLINVQSVTATIEAMGIECIGIHYRGVEKLLSPCNTEQALAQIEYFIQTRIWVSDAEWEAQANSL